MLGIWQILLRNLYKLSYYQLKKINNSFINFFFEKNLLCCLSGANHIFVASICKSYAVKFIIVLTFFLNKIYQTQNKCFFISKIFPLQGKKEKKE